MHGLIHEPEEGMVSQHGGRKVLVKRWHNPWFGQFCKPLDSVAHYCLHPMPPKGAVAPVGARPDEVGDRCRAILHFLTAACGPDAAPLTNLRKGRAAPRAGS